MNKKIIIPIIIVVILLLITTATLWWLEEREIKGSPDDYVIKETEEGTIVENKKAGLRVKAPEGWGVKKLEIEEGAVDFSSPDFEAEQKEGKIVLPLKNGCKIQSSIGYAEDKKLTFADIKLELKYSFALMGMKSVTFEETTINNYPALKSIFDLKEEGSGVGMSISIPVDNKIYGFSAMWAPNEEEKCIQEFNKFLETVSIK